MKKYFIPLLILLISCSSNGEKRTPDSIPQQNSSIGEDIVSIGDVKDESFKEYLSKFQISAIPLTFTLDSIGNFLNYGPPGFEPKPVIQISLLDIEKYIGNKEKEEFVEKNKEFDDRLKYYYAYSLKKKENKIISCLVLKRQIDVISEYLLLNYDLNGKLIDKLQVVASYNDDKLQAEVEKTCVIKESEIIIETKIPTNDLTVITERYQIKDDGKFFLLDKKKEKKELPK